MNIKSPIASLGAKEMRVGNFDVDVTSYKWLYLTIFIVVIAVIGYLIYKNYKSDEAK